MVRYKINDLQEGMVLGESIILPTGKLLLAAGYQVTRQYKERLTSLGYNSLLIHEAGTEEVIPETLVSSQTQNNLAENCTENGKKLQTIAEAFRAEAAQDVSKMIFKNRQSLNKHIMNPMVMKQLETVIEQVMSQNSIVLNLAVLKKSSGLFFERAVNVTITSLCIGRKYHFSQDEIKQLAVGALNYHIGLAALPREILEKQVALSEDEQKVYRQHTTFGYLMLAQNNHVSPVSQIVALQHHELQNGTGYPLGLKGSNKSPIKDISQTHVIHRFAEIVSVADTYYTLLGDDYLSHPQAIQNAVSKMIKLSGVYLNSHIIKTLSTIVPVFPVGARIIITEAPNVQLKQCVGVVAKDNPTDLSRPQIILYESAAKKRIDPPIRIDTAKAPSISFELLI
jgi:HD-GYP domain-containing protein (c-di-GMP phosphodiesterase class II)